MSDGAKRIIAAREALGVSQEEFARLLDVDRKTVGRWERGENDPKFGDVQAAEALVAKRKTRRA